LQSEITANLSFRPSNIDVIEQKHSLWFEEGTHFASPELPHTLQSMDELQDILYWKTL